VAVAVPAGGVERVGERFRSRRSGPLDELHLHAAGGTQHHGAHRRFGQLEPLDHLVEPQGLPTPALLGVEVGHPRQTWWKRTAGAVPGAIAALLGRHAVRLPI
jgi:hypothetical protein